MELSVWRGSLSSLSRTDACVNFFVVKSIIGFSTLFTSNLSRFMSRLERRLLHRSVAHYESASPRKVTPLNLPLAWHYCLTCRVRQNTRPVLYLHESYLAVGPIHQGRNKEGELTAFFGQAILDTRRDLSECFSLDQPSLVQVFQNISKGLGAYFLKLLG